MAAQNNICVIIKLFPQLNRKNIYMPREKTFYVSKTFFLLHFLVMVRTRSEFAISMYNTLLYYISIKFFFLFYMVSTVSIFLVQSYKNI